MNKRLIYILSGILLGFYGCDVIDEPERVIETDELHFTNKVVLLEDFTGYKCLNCPTAAEESARLEEWFDGHLIVVSIHAGNYANTSGTAWQTDFRTEAGETYNEYFRPDGYPSAMTDRKSFNGTLTNSNISTWASQAVARLAEVSPVSILLTPSTAGADPSLSVEVIAQSSMPDDTYLQVWLIEDNIVAPQLMPDNSINYTYTHRHVFRAAVNGTWGESLTDLPGTENHRKGTYNYSLPSDWKPEDCSWIAFVYKGGSKEILQSATTDLIP
ncbi:hypothetical protein M2459_000674 [Parabacteroides sp. PF5-5]|uniref:Omp28 family outer membrane lipoprotein n=1 Tax=unclassified Parabacteroides TaxID=2649774 RepID=UPI002474CCD8|nr:MULTISPECIES: Omp28 family outer membrane lipoprotein [unclassified Parabacteroides]MDH6303392.1 hypothetical protein [Parabacteroides sp. PH5-39]MDH6314715.1 hypothetical protein [Parabacteroides sp. PF5-13]MDH6318052.1 hypothetical protein [Parabacteroides sp. PH5-13]MDH6322017.1 hypothetical protein [Parabacteroides sp. PH5-8]MDH6326140.1 hypothetical protein [Parabacteroides sp. PH5-41]